MQRTDCLHNSEASRRETLCLRLRRVLIVGISSGFELPSNLLSLAWLATTPRTSGSKEEEFSDSKTFLTKSVLPYVLKSEK